MVNEFPRKDSALYGMITRDKERRKRTLNNWRKMNKVVVFLYEMGLFPLFGLGRFIALLYTEGRYSGKSRVTPLEYRKRDGMIILFSARGAQSDWFRNLKTNPDKAKLRIGFKTIIPEVELVSDPDKVEEYLRWYIDKHPRSSHFLFGWDPKKDNLGDIDLSSLVKLMTVVKLSKVI
jgi:deazaflavin-dependent oxidoreductase (nitroreductase family)